jgi:anti-sigma factor RsiW
MTSAKSRMTSADSRMTSAEDTAEPDRRTLAELSALADGTLDPGRVPAVQELIADSPELSRRYERELRAVAALHAVRPERAPAQLRIRLSARRVDRRPRRRRLLYAGALGSAVAAAVAALVLLLPGGAPGSPSVSQAAALALRGAVMAAPATHPGANRNQDVQEIYFPDWSRAGWRAVGQRVDRFENRTAVTVYYEWKGKRVAYTILAAPALRRPTTRMRRLDGLGFQSLASGGRLIVTWRRAGHTCILSGSGVSTAELARLAAQD